MNRRTVIKAISAIPFMASSSFAGAKGKKPSVIVIGAGISGLNAALKLLDAGASVTVLEARTRLGGRAFTSRTWGDLPVDLGASWIHGQAGNPLVSLARQAGAKPTKFDYGSASRYWSDGKALSDSEDAKLDEFNELVNDTLADYEDKPAMKASEALSGIASGISPVQMRLLAHAMCGEIEHEFGSPPSELSIAGYLEGDAFKGGDLLFPGQAGMLTDFLAQQVKKLGGRILLGVPVGGIKTGTRGVKVSLRGQELQADHVVLTAPLGVLQAGSIAVPMPSDHRAAIGELKMGSLEKLILRFPKVFWPSENFLSVIPELSKKGEWVESVNLHNFTAKPVLMMFNGGTFGRRTAQIEDLDLVKQAMSVIKNVFPRADQPTAFQRSRWANDPFTMGSYSFGAGADPEQSRMALRVPIEGRIWLAGEHTSIRAPQSLHGAYLEGERVAKDLIGKS